MIRKRLKDIFWGNKKWWLIGGGGVIVIISGLAAWSVYAWQDYDQSYKAQYSTFHEQSKQALELPVGTADERSRKLTSLKGVIERDNLTCGMYQWLHFERFITAIDDKIKQCEQGVSRANNLVAGIREMVTFIEEEGKIIEIFSSVAGSGDVDEGAWAGELGRWTKVVSDLEGMSVAASLNPIKDSAIKKAKGVKDGWSGVIVASEAKDRAKYESAVDQLGVAYGAVGEVSQVSQALFKDIVTRVEERSRALLDKA